MVNDQLRRTIICRQFNLNATHDGNWCAVLDVVVRGIAFIVMNREGLHFTGLREDTCPDVVDVKLLVVRLLEGDPGLLESGVCVLAERRRRIRRQIPPTWINCAENAGCITYMQCDISHMNVSSLQSKWIVHIQSWRR